MATATLTAAILKRNITEEIDTLNDKIGSLNDKIDNLESLIKDLKKE